MINRRLFAIFGLRPTGDFGPWTFYTDRRGTPVWFVKAPPLVPPTERQIAVREELTEYANLWTDLADQVKANWERASKRACLGMTGYNLWQWWKWHGNEPVIRTIERQSGVALLA